MCPFAAVRDCPYGEKYVSFCFLFSLVLIFGLIEKDQRGRIFKIMRSSIRKSDFPCEEEV